MAAKAKEQLNNDIQDSMTVVVHKETDEYTGPRVRIFLPALEDEGSAGLKVDQYEHVTIANEDKEKVYYILRGEPVEVPVPVYMVLKEKYPKL